MKPWPEKPAQRRPLPPELAASLANAVHQHFAGRYPSDNRLAVARQRSSVLLHKHNGRSMTQAIAKTTFTKALMDVRLHESASYEALRDGASVTLKAYYAQRFYQALDVLWEYLEARIDDDL